MTAAPRYDQNTALIVVDVQNDFADPGGSLYVRGGEDIISLVNVELAEAHAAGALVVYTQDWHPEDTPHFEKDGGIWPSHCVQGTRGASFHPDLVVDGSVVRKGATGEDGYSGFTVRDPRSGETAPTVLEGLLREVDVRRVVVCGLATDYCVKDTALDAVRLDFDAELLADAVRAVDLRPGDGARAVAAMVTAGVKVT